MSSIAASVSACIVRVNFVNTSSDLNSVLYQMVVATVLISLLQHHYQMGLSLIQLEKKVFNLEENYTVVMVLLPTRCLANADS